jgi:uncharacterized membrane protein
MDKRPLPDRQRDWLQTELDHWIEEGLITPEQRAGIVGQYESKGDVSRKKQSRGVFVLQAIAMSLVALAMLLLIGFNWESLPGGLRIAVVLGAMLAAHATGVWLRWTRQKPLAGEIATFLGCFLYGCGIWQIGQVFHISSDNADGAWVWAIGILPFALLLESSLLHAFLVAVLAIWVGAEILGFGSSQWWGWWRVPSGCYTLPLLTAPGILWSYRRNATKTLAMYLPLVAWWLILLPISWSQGEFNPIYFVGVMAALFLAVAEAHRVGNPLSIPFRFYGAIVTVGFLFLLSFADLQRELLGRSGEWYLFPGIALLVVGLGVIAGLARWGAPHAEDSPAFLVRCGQRYWLPAGLIVLYTGLSLWSLLWGYAGSDYQVRSSLMIWDLTILIPCLVTNIATVAMAVWLMRVGLREDRSGPFFGGVVLFLAWAFARYVDLFGGVGGMLGAALMFFLCGAGLFGLARFWSQRKGSSE